MAKTIKDKVIEILVDELGVDEEECTPEASITDDLGADSLDRIEIQMMLEEEFGIEMSDVDGVELKTVQNIVDFLYSKGVVV